MAENNEKNESGIVLGSADTARILGISVRRLQQLTKEGILVKEDYGKYEIGKVVQAYLAFRISLCESDDEETLNFKKEKTLLTRAQRKKAEVDLAIVKGELHKAEDVERVMMQMLSIFRNRCLTIPSRASPLLIKKSLDEIKTILRTEINNALQELSDYDPSMFYKASEEDERAK